MANGKVQHVFIIAVVLGVFLGLISFIVTLQLLPQPCIPSYLQNNYWFASPIVFGALGLFVLNFIRKKSDKSPIKGYLIFLVIFILTNFILGSFFNSSSLCGAFWVGTNGISFGSPFLDLSGHLSGIMYQNSNSTLYNLAISCSILSQSLYQNIQQPRPFLILANGSSSDIFANGNNTIQNPLSAAAGQQITLSEIPCYWANGTAIQSMPIGTVYYGITYFGYTSQNGAIGPQNVWKFKKVGNFSLKSI